MATQPHRPDGKTVFAAIATVATVYGYFLIFAQFGFLKAVQAALGDGAGAIRPLMAAMGLAGIAGSVAAARGFAARSSRQWFAAGCGISAAAAAWSMAARNQAEFAGVALLAGLGVGLTTVMLAGMLRPALGDARLGTVIGLGTGLAYGFCNLPGIFEAGATAQAAVAVVAAVAGGVTGSLLRPGNQAEPRRDGDYSARGVAWWGLIFLAMVCLDSALFFLIQHTPGLKGVLWADPARQSLNAAVHLGAAAAAGWALDRRWLGRTAVLSAGALGMAVVWINGHPAGETGIGLLYIAGVSAYSTALVFYPARSGRPGLAALIYAVAGWVGSALGISLAEGRDHLPTAMIAALGGLLGMGLLGRYFASRGARTMNENSG